jgi:hypothetical protein
MRRQPPMVSTRRTLLQLHGQVAAQGFRHVLADAELAQVLKVGQPFQEQDAVDDLVSAFHDLDGRTVFPFAQCLETPVPERAGVQEVLVDGRELVLQNKLQSGDDVRVALHLRSPLSGNLANGGLQIVPQADAVDQAELGFQPVGMVLFSVAQQLDQDAAGFEIPLLLAMGDGFLQLVDD